MNDSEKTLMISKINYLIDELQAMKKQLVKEIKISQDFENVSMLQLIKSYPYNSSSTARTLNILNWLDYSQRSVSDFVREVSKEQFLSCRNAGKKTIKFVSEVIKSKTGLTW